MNRKIILFTLATFAASMAGSAAWAVGDNNSEPPKKTKTTTQCKDGKIWDAKRNRCVEAKRSDLGDDILFDAARELAYAGQYENAIKVLDAMREQRSARVLNYMATPTARPGAWNSACNTTGAPFRPTRITFSRAPIWARLWSSRGASRKRERSLWRFATAAAKTVGHTGPCSSRSEEFVNTDTRSSFLPRCRRANRLGIPEREKTLCDPALPLQTSDQVSYHEPCVRTANRRMIRHVSLEEKCAQRQR